jgi:hypothetical protein
MAPVVRDEYMQAATPDRKAYLVKDSVVDQLLNFSFEIDAPISKQNE